MTKKQQKESYKYKLILKQNGVEYDLGKLPKGFVIQGDVIIPEMKDLTILPDMSTVTVKGNFDCRATGLKTLQGAPIRVEGDFMCDDNKLRSLEGAPQWVGGKFSCCYNKLGTLKGGPQYVGRGYNCSFANLTSLNGAPAHVGGSFNCRGSREAFGSYYGSGDVNNEYDDWNDENANLLKTLKGAPAYVGGDFLCFRNCLTSLKGLPKMCGGEVEYYDNNIPDGFEAVDYKVTVKVLKEKTR